MFQRANMSLLVVGCIVPTKRACAQTNERAQSDQAPECNISPSAASAGHAGALVCVKSGVTAAP